MTRRFLLIPALTLACLSAAGGAKPKTLSISATVDRGTMLCLTDGSAWEVRPENRPKVASWPMKTQVAVYKIDDREFPYRLVLRPGKSDGDIVAARRLTRIK